MMPNRGGRDESRPLPDPTSRPAGVFFEEALPAAAHRENGAIDERRLVTREKRDGIADIFPTARVRRRIPVVTALGGRLAIGIFVADVAGIDDVARDAVRAFLKRERLDERRQPGLRSDVCR